MSAAAEWRRAAAEVLKAWSVVLVLWLLPLDVLFRIDTFRTMDMSRIDWPFALSVVALLLFLVALGVAATFGAVLLVPCALGRTAAVARIRRANLLVLLFFAAYWFMIFCKSWMQKVLGIRFTPSFTIKILLAACALAAVIAFRKRAADRLELFFSKKFGYVLIPVAAASLVVVASRELSHRGAPAPPAPRPAPAAPAPPNVILVTFDALRAADLPAYGYRLDTAPHLDRFSRESFVIEHAISNGNWTRPSVASLLTGRYPSRHRIVNTSPGNNFLPAEMTGRTLPGALRRLGYQTLAVVSNVDQAHPLITGTYADFDAAPLETFRRRNATWRDRAVSRASALLRLLPHLDGSVFNWIREIERNYFSFLKWNVGTQGRGAKAVSAAYAPSATFEKARELIRGATPPFFLWVHLMPPHWPYLSSPRQKGTFLKGEIGDRSGLRTWADSRTYDPGEQPVIDRYRLLYDESILYADEAFGGFVEFLKGAGCYDNSLILVTADHGESFERGFWKHGGAPLHDPLIHIPLLIRTPGQTEGKRVRTNAEQADVLPTVLDLLGRDVPGWADGESLKNAMLGNAPSAKPKFSMQLEGTRFGAPPRRGTIAVVRGDYKYNHSLATGRGELYDLSRDPGETADLSARSPQVVAEMKRLIEERLAADGRR